MSRRVFLSIGPAVYAAHRRKLLLCALTAWAVTAACPAQSTWSSQPVEKQLRAMRVFDPDERIRVTDTTQFPWAAVGRIQSIWRKPDSIIVISTGTGALIGERVVLTAGHIVYDQDDGWADEVVFVPGLSGGNMPFGSVYSVRSIAQRAWVEEHDNRYDIAMIVLDEPVGQETGYFPVTVESDAFFIDRSLNSAGYPGESKPGDLQYHSYGTSLDVQNGLIRHMLDSEPGQSGSPLWYYDPSGPSRRIVGVLTGSREVAAGGEVVDAFNVGVPINAAFGAWIEETLSRYDNVVQDTSVDESDSSTAPAACGAGLPVAAISLVLLACLRVLSRRDG